MYIFILSYNRNSSYFLINNQQEYDFLIITYDSEQITLSSYNTLITVIRENTYFIGFIQINVLS
ncbi:MAG: hypothetical protein ArsCj_3860 [Arsenophonus endosymbiont of Ceratovacuna japonica]